MGEPKKQRKHRTLENAPIDPFALFKVVRQTYPETFYFESSRAIGQGRSDVTVLGIGPFSTLREHHGQALLVDQQGTRALKQSFLMALAEKIGAIQIPEFERGAVPFARGGLFGVIGYDCVAYLEAKVARSGYFAARETNPLPNAEILIVSRLLVVDHRNAQIHIVDTEGNNEALDCLQALVHQAFRDQVSKPVSPFNAHTPPKEVEAGRLRSAVSAQGFARAVEIIKHHIRRGDIFQAVLAESFECQTEASPFSIFEALRAVSPAPYSFFFPFAERCFFGASPESLVRIENGRLCSHPIAGTRPRGKSLREDRALARSLIRSRKEAAEHMMLVDLARNDLGRVARPGSVHVRSFRSLHRFSNVMHLVSEVEAELDARTSALSAFLACFPAGTLSGAPKVKAMEILAQLEPVPRGFYGGAVVAFDGHGGLDSCIAIRSAEMRAQTVLLRAGAGVVADSKAVNEYAEIHHKLLPLRQAIAMAEQGSLQGERQTEPDTERREGVVS